MRCRKCGEKAVINMRQHRLSLCKQHYLEWLPAQIQKTIKKYGMFSEHDRILVAVSGGKDSLALWDILWKLGFHTEGLYINLGINSEITYSNRSMKFAQEFANNRSLTLHIADIKKDHGESIPEISIRTRRGRDKPCSLCGLIKRHIMNRFALDGQYNVLATAHNLDDEAAILLANTLDWSLEFLARGKPVLSSKPGFVKKVKPFFRTYEREAAAYAILRRIEYMRDECPFSTDSKQLYYKKYLNEWEETRPGTKLRFYLNYLKAISHGAFPGTQESAGQLAQQRCSQCGQPTNTGGLCAFCKLFDHT